MRSSCRHHLVWAVVGDWYLHCCAHCDHVVAEWPRSDGDTVRSVVSLAAHDQHCGLSVVWMEELLKGYGVAS